MTFLVCFFPFARNFQLYYSSFSRSFFFQGGVTHSTRNSSECRQQQKKIKQEARTDRRAGNILNFIWPSGWGIGFLDTGKRRLVCGDRLVFLTATMATSSGTELENRVWTFFSSGDDPGKFLNRKSDYGGVGECRQRKGGKDVLWGKFCNVRKLRIICEI